MNSFIRGEFEGTRQPWRDDPASDLVDELEHELADELEMAQTEPRRRPGAIGRLVDEDEGGLDDHHREATARDSGDDQDLSAEEAALHYVDEEAAPDADLTPEVQAQLDQF